MNDYLIIAVIIVLVLLVLMFVALTLYRARNMKMAKELSEMRDSFFSNVTHESRTPLTVILGLSHDIQEDPAVSEEVRKKARSIERQGNKMLTLVNQILDVSKVKSSVGDPKWQNSDIISFLARIVSSYQPYADSRGIGLRFVNYGPSVIRMDFVPDYVTKVMNNLLSNAFKYTQTGGRIQVLAASTGGRLKIEVEDSGTGINKEALKHIFEPYYQSSSGMRAIGTGIGLTLVKNIIDKVEGVIEVESTLGKGSVFRINVPIRNERKSRDRQTESVPVAPLLPDDDDLVHTDLGAVAADDNECRILIVDDNSDIAEFIGLELPDTYSIYYAADGVEGLARTLELTPDIVITDWMMPKMNGVELCRRIRDNEIINHIPVVILTARALDEDRLEGTKAGADAYLVKPFNSEELKAVVHNLMESRRIMREKFHLASPRIMQTPEIPETVFLDKVYESVKGRVEKNEKVDVPQVAFDLCMSTSQLYRKIKSISGSSPAEYFQSIKVAAAQELICIDPDLPLSEVASRCGFNDYSGFVRAFKSVLGQTPSEYRDKSIAILN